MKNIFTLPFALLLSLASFGQQGGYALYFDGVDDYVNLTTSSIPSSGAITVETWIMVTEFQTNLWEGVIYERPGSSAHGFMLRCGASGVIDFALANSYKSTEGGSSIVTSNDALTINKWYHIAATYNGTIMKLFLNGIEIGSANYTGDYVANSNANIGRSPAFNSRVFKGYIDEVRIWNVARTQQEIRDNMYKEIGAHTNLKAYYRMSDGTGTSLTDNSGNGNTGSISGSTWNSSTAPLPYFTVTDGSWATDATWATGQYVPANDWASVKINNTVTMETGVGKTVNDLSVGVGANLTVESGGSLITNGTITNNGTINVKRSMADGRWHLVSAPVAGATAEPFTGKYLQSWSEPTHSFSQITLANTPLAPATGYLLWGNAPGKASHTTYTFTGTPLTGAQSKALTYTDNGSGNKGANLVGNPYPSSIDWDLLRVTYGAVYYLDNGEYIEWNGEGVGGGSRYISPLQGFFVVVNGNSTLNLSNAHRSHDNANLFYKQATASDVVVLETVSPDGYSDKLYMRFDPEALPNFELPRDAWKLPSFADGISQLWSVDPDGGRLSIDVRPATESIPVGFSNTANGTYSIGVAQLGNQPALFLEDTQTGTIHNFANGDYHFNYTLTDNPNRFKLLFGAIGTPETENSPISQWIAGSTLYISAPTLAGQQVQVTVYSLTGQALQRQQVTLGEINAIALHGKQGALVVETKSENGSRVLTTKGIIIK